MWANANTNSHVGWQSISDGNSYVYAYPDGSGYSYTYGYSWHTVTHTDVSAGQPIHDSSDRRQHRARHHGHRQSRGRHGNHHRVAIPYTLYDQTFTSINLSSNGNAQFTTTDTTFGNLCLPWAAHNYTIFPYWDDLYLVNSGFGIFTSISGTAPNRIFNIEWRAQYFPGSGSAGFELRLYEGQTRFDVIYGTVTNGNTSRHSGSAETSPTFTQYFCNGTGGAATGGQSYTLQGCGTPTPTPTATGSCTPSSFHVLIAYSDTAAPTQLQSEILAEPGVIAVDLFDAQAGTPTLAQLQQYQIVVPYQQFPVPGRGHAW